MKSLFAYLLVLGFSLNSFSQTGSNLKFILVPHPRSENRTVQSVLPDIEKIDFSLYDMTLLGGDLTYYTSISRTSMDYCDKLFNLKSPNTLWTMGNHDLNSRSLIQEYTGRPSYYAYFRSEVTFVVLDVELNANGFVSSDIAGAQLTWLKNVTDTISKSEYLVVLHGRMLWMIGNPDFKARLDSVAESTKQMISSNFYTDVFPLLQKVKAKGIPVMCLGGDKSKINIDYSPEDSIRFFASTMAPEFTSDQNHVLVFNFDQATRQMSWKFVSLTNIEKKQANAIAVVQSGPVPVFKVWTGAGLHEINLQLQSENSGNTWVEIYSADGRLCYSFRIQPYQKMKFNLNKAGFYVVKATIEGTMLSSKVAVR